jgi:hypothetical protein
MSKVKRRLDPQSGVHSAQPMATAMEKRKELKKTADSIFEKFGNRGIRPGSLIEK